VKFPYIIFTLLVLCFVGGADITAASFDEGSDYTQNLLQDQAGPGTAADQVEQEFPESTEDGIEVDGIPAPPVAEASWLTWFWDNSDNILGIIGALMALLAIIVRLTPTKRDDIWYAWLNAVIPNNKKGGGKHP
jgi:hypothetical protein